MFDQNEKNILLETARNSILNGFKNFKPLKINPRDYPKSLQQKLASFVTLKKSGELRGCIGTLIAHETLIENVSKNAFQASFHDPRFPALEKSEFRKIHLSISVLTTPQKIAVKSEEELLSKINPHHDGLILRDGGAQATFLPAVWKSLPNPKDFLNHLKRKAGLPDNYWSNTLEFETYSAIEIHE